MSDARKTQPSFDDLVRIIEKNFKAGLFQSKAFTEYEVNEEWGKFKIRNHLFKDTTQPGAVWVKASERLPGWKLKVKWRDGNNHSHATDGTISLYEMDKPNFEGWEWLDESSADQPGREVEAVEFHDWVEKKRWEFDHREQRTHSTAELYKLFKEQKEVGNG